MAKNMFFQYVNEFWLLRIFKNPPYSLPATFPFNYLQSVISGKLLLSSGPLADLELSSLLNYRCLLVYQQNSYGYHRESTEAISL
jgi:hypothetical protein